MAPPPPASGPSRLGNLSSANPGGGGYGSGGKRARGGGGVGRHGTANHGTVIGGASGGTGVYTAPQPLKAEGTPAKKRYGAKKKAAEQKRLPEAVEAVIPQSALYNQLLDLEKKIDQTLSRKKLDVQEALKRPVYFPRVLRVYVFNTYTPGHQLPVRGAKSTASEGPMWTLRIVGRLLEAASHAPETEGLATLPPPPIPGSSDAPSAGGTKGTTVRLSTFIKKLTVDLSGGSSTAGGPQVVVWDSSKVGHAEVDGFEIKRAAVDEFVAKITIDMNYQPQRFKLSPQLQAVLGLETETKTRIISALWEYVKMRNLQDPMDASIVRCDKVLETVVGTPAIRFPELAKAVSRHLSLADPLVIHCPVRLTGPSPAIESCYDISIDTALPLDKETSAFLAKLEDNKEVDAINDKITSAIRSINEHKRRRAFYMGFSSSPVDFINALVVSQTRDLRVARGENGRDPESERVSDYFNAPWVEDAVVRYLHRRATPGDVHRATEGR